VEKTAYFRRITNRHAIRDIADMRANQKLDELIERHLPTHEKPGN